MKLLLVFAVFLLAVSAQLNLDTFRVFGQATANEIEPVGVSIVSGDGILGGRRVLTVTRVSGDDNALEASCTAVGGFFALSTDVSVIGNCRARYAGASGNGFDTPVNFNNFGCDCWNLRILESDNNVNLDIEVESVSNGMLSSSLTLTVDIDDPTDVCLPYQAPASNYRDVEAVDFIITGNEQNVDVNVQYVCCQPSISCYHTITALNGADIDNLNAGDTIKMSLSCFNYVSIPADIQTFDATFEFDSTVGTMDAGSLMCMGPDITAQGVNTANNAMEFSGRIADNEEITCMVEVELTDGGSVDDIQATIFTPNTDPMFPILSHAGSDRSGSIEFCDPPESSNLVIQNPPTTLPPTTGPPSTLPPTTLPPTTAPPVPNDLECISPRIINGVCDCQTFPCNTLPDGDIQCETQEWYCYFIVRRSPGNSLHVGYRGQMCTCDL